MKATTAFQKFLNEALETRLDFRRQIGAPSLHRHAVMGERHLLNHGQRFGEHRLHGAQHRALGQLLLLAV